MVILTFICKVRNNFQNNFQIDYILIVWKNFVVTYYFILKWIKCWLIIFSNLIVINTILVSGLSYANSDKDLMQTAKNVFPPLPSKISAKKKSYICW